jgi:TRAP-type C4-dicarboxylate transport system substrate-binding protein
LAFIQSLKEMMKQEYSLGNLLFKFILLNSENFAFSPTWWESLSEDNQKEISQAISNMMHPTMAIREHYSMNGLNNISNWNFETIDTNLTTVSKDNGDTIPNY